MPEISKDTGRRGERITMLHWRHAYDSRVDAGDVVSLQSDATDFLSATANAEGAAVFEGLAEGVYWISVKPDGEDSERLGSVIVNPIADKTEIRFRAEIKRLDERIQSDEALNCFCKWRRVCDKSNRNPQAPRAKVKASIATEFLSPWPCRIWALPDGLGKGIERWQINRPQKQPLQDGSLGPCR